MKNIIFISTILYALLSVVGCSSTGKQSSGGGAAAEISREANMALQQLYQDTPDAKVLGAKAKGILVFPEILKAGFIAGAHLGDGALFKNGRTAGYYNSVAVSYGIQAGIQKHGYALFFMTDEALAYLENSAGWEIGVGPNIVLVDTGAAKKLSTTTAKDGIYAFIFGQKGLMAGAGLQGSKITKINP